MRKGVLASILALSLMLPGMALAATGTIDPANIYSQFCGNASCSAHTLVNWLPTNGGGVTVTDTGLTGYIWSEKFGWINLNPTNGGVHNTTGGVLSGYAWGQGAGWINFAPTNGGVFINTTTGAFSGYAWGQSAGYMRFDCGVTNACVVTSWRPTTGGTSGGGTSGGHGGGPTGGGSSGSGTSGSGTGGSGTTGTGTSGSTTSGATTGGTTTGTSTTGGTSGTSGADTTGTGGTTTGTDGSTTGTSGSTSGTTSTDGGTGSTGADGSGGTSGVSTGTDSGASTTGGVSGASGGTGTGGGFGTGASGGSSSGGSTGGIDTIISPIVVQQVKELYAGTKQAVVKTATAVQQAVTTPAGDAVTTAVTSVGVVATSAITVTSALFINPLSFSELFLIPVRLWTLFLAAVGLSKRRKPWGTVYDSVTKQPIDPAYVVLRDADGKEVMTGITDLDGRYGFIIPAPGVYSIIAHKTNYLFPSQHLVGRDHDELYRDLYFGEHFTATEAGQIVIKNIPLDPEKFDWNEFAKKQQHLMKFYQKRDRWLLKLSDIMFGIGFAVSAVALLAAPRVYNILIFAMYVILFILRKLGLHAKSFGYVTDSRGYGVPFAVIRITSAGSGVEVMHRVTDQKGKYYALLPNGDYLIRIDMKLPDGSYQTLAANIPVAVTKGYLAKAFMV